MQGCGPRLLTERLVYEKQFNKVVGTEGEEIVRAITEPKGGNVEKVITGFPVKDFLLSLLPGMAFLEGMKEGVELGGAAADKLQEKALQGPIGRHRRDVEAALSPKQE